MVCSYSVGEGSRLRARHPHHHISVVVLLPYRSLYLLGPWILTATLLELSLVLLYRSGN